jgi:hypothetical protein
MQNSSRTNQRISKTRQAFDRFYEERRQSLIGLLRRMPSVVETVCQLKEMAINRNYKVVIPPELLERIKDGSARFGKSGTDGWSANIHGSKTGEIIGQVSLAEVSPELASSLSQLAVQSMLAEIAQRLEIIEEKIGEVLQGQRDDRAGLLDSAENLYAMASVATEPENRRFLLANTVMQLSEARGRMIRSLESGIQTIHEIPTHKWEIVFRSLVKDIPQDVERRAELLESTFRDVLRASCLMALSCGQLGETVSLKKSWQPLERFIPEVRKALEKIVRWFPNDPYALPDKFSTLLSATDGLVQAGKQLQRDNARALEIDFTPDELANGEDTT